MYCPPEGGPYQVNCTMLTALFNPCSQEVEDGTLSQSPRTELIPFKGYVKCKIDFIYF